MEQARVPFILPVERGVRATGSLRALEIARRRGARSETLIVLIETSSRQAESLVARATTAIGRDFERRHGSATAICRQAIQTVDHVFRTENRRLPAAQQVSAAATVLLLRGVQCVAARAGAGAVAIRHHGRLTSIADGPDDQADFPLGAPVVAEPALGAQELLPSDGVIALAGPLMTLSIVEWLALFDLPAGTAAERLRLAGGSTASFAACVLAPQQAANRAADPSRAAVLTRLADRRPDRRLPRTPGPTEPIEPAEPIELPIHRRFGGGPGPTSGRPIGRDFAHRSYGGRSTPRPGAARGLIAAISAVPRPNPRAIVGAIREMMPSDSVRPPAGGAVAAAVAIDRQPWATTPTLRMPEFGDAIKLPAMVVGLFLAMVLMGAVAWYVPPLLKPADPGVGKLLDAADATRLKALVITDRDQTRRELNGVMKAVQDVLIKDPASVRAQQLLVMVESDLNRLDAIYKLPDAKPLIAENALPAGGQGVAHVARRDGDLYVVDKTAGRGYRAVVGGTGATLSSVNPLPVPVARQATTGDTKPVPIRTLVWMPAGAARQNEGTLAIDADRNLWELDTSGQLRRLVLRGAQNWQSYKTALGYGGNLYVLDPKGNQVWRYSATQDGYNSEPKAMLEAARIGDAVDFAIDGSIYVLGSNGRVWKFQSGVGRELSLQGIDRPLRYPSAIFTDADTKQLWIADTGNRRIVVLDKDGNFVRQITLDSDVGDLVVNEGRQRLYFVADNQLFVSSLP